MGDGTVEPTEQCEGKSYFCDDACHSTEVRLSIGATANNTTDGATGDKFDPSFLWPEQSGTAGRFFAFFTDRTPGSNEVAMRVLSDGFLPSTTPPYVNAGEAFLPNGSLATGPSTAAPGAQGSSQGAILGGSYYVVFQDDNTASSSVDIHMRSMDSSLIADQTLTTPLVINGSTCADATTCAGEPATQNAPAVAASGPKLLVAWQDASGAINGRVLTPPNALSTQQAISTGTGNTAVQLAATATGWVATWQSGTTVKMRLIAASGTAQGSEATVNTVAAATNAHPSVASLADGRFAIAFAGSGTGSDIYVQRYAADGTPVKNDQSAPINNVTTAGDQTLPKIASTSAASGAYAIVWLNGTDVQARLQSATSGFLPNSLTGQDDEFTASIGTKTRTNPVVAIGGAASNLIIGWEDKSTTAPGIIARLFPTPSQ